MTSTPLPRPDESEYAPFYAGYVRLSGDDVTSTLEQQRAEIEALRALAEPAATHRYAEGKWSVKEVIGHITDAERIFAYRMLRIARGDTTPLASFDEQMFVAGANFDALPMDTLIDSFAAARASTLALIAELDGGVWARTGTASGKPVSARALAHIIAGHAAHHIAILRDRYGIN